MYLFIYQKITLTIVKASTAGPEVLTLSKKTDPLLPAEREAHGGRGLYKPSFKI